MSRDARDGRRWAAPLLALRCSGPVAARAAGPTAFGHVFVVVLENTAYASVIPASMPYLTGLAASGVSLDQYYAVDHASLTNYIALTSGKASNALTRADCLLYNCVYEPPNDVNLADQLEAAGLDWKGYMESMPAPCAHGTEGSLDPYLVGYATRHNPFVYYRDIVGNPSRCTAHDVPYTQLAADLANDTVPAFALIVPNSCDDAHDGGASCGLDDADVWLSQNLPPILSSAAFADRGVLVVTFDESSFADTSGCCGDRMGGHVATFVFSPLVAGMGAHSATPYSHYSLLRTVEKGFRLLCLDRACDPGSHFFGPEVLAADYCGDGVVDAGEDCDPGADVSGDCCSATCHFETAGTACASDADACTADACDAAGTCLHTAIDCDDHDPCTDDTCDPADGCHHAPIVDATFLSIECRLAALVADVTSGPGLDPTPRRRLLGLPTHALQATQRAQGVAAKGSTASARAILHGAARRLVGFEFRVKSYTGGQTITADTAARLLAQSGPLIADLGALSGGL